ncbi:hypothetical protein M404DRAFT_80882, partial [Pisolithus tinctorius Marx 270]
ILFWLEAMSLLGGVGNAAAALISAQTWLLDGWMDTLGFVEDGFRFIQSSNAAISHSAPHVYMSGLTFLPVKTKLLVMLMPNFSSLPGVVGGLEHWPASQLLGLEGHTGAVTSVAFSLDGKRIVSGSADRTVRLWGAETGVQIGSHLEGHTDAVFSVAFSPDGKRIVIASGSEDKTVGVWDAETGVQIGSHLEGHTDGILSVAFSPDGKRIVSASLGKTMRVWDANGYEHMISTHEHLKSYPSNLSNPLVQVKLYDDGWIRGPKGELLLWIPIAMRSPLYSMWTTVVMPRGCCIELDLSQMVHGTKWHQC